VELLTLAVAFVGVSIVALRARAVGLAVYLWILLLYPDYLRISIGTIDISAAQSVTIGKNVLFASNVLVSDSDHVVEPGGVPVTRNAKFVTRPVRIEDNC